MKKYLVALGNWTMGDDSIGLRIVEEIVRRGLDRDFEAVLLPDSGLNLIDYLRDDTEKILIVDTVQAGKEPGDWFLFEPESVQTRKHLDGISTHEGDVLKVIELARELNYPTPKIVILGIQPASVGPGELSDALKERFEEYLLSALREISPGLA